MITDHLPRLVTTMTPKVKTSIALLLGLVAGSAALQIPIVPTRAGDTVFGEENERTGWREEAPDGPDFPIPDLPVPDIHAVPIMVGTPISVGSSR